MNFGYFIEFNKTKKTKLNLIDPNVKVFKTNKYIFIIDGYIKDREGNLPDGHHSSLVAIKPDEVIKKLESQEH